MVHVNPPLDKKAVGTLGESVAAEFLRRKGFAVITMNYRKPWGEIDIIAEKGNSVRFVEVKTLSFEVLPDISRENNTYRPEEQVHPAKLKKVMRTAELYMAEKNDPRDFQVDVVGVFMDPVRRKARCRLYEGVF
jgi:putative endonuclease